MGRFWMIRVGEGGTLARLFERTGYIGIGWEKTGTFAGIETLSGMTACLARAYPAENPHSLRNSAAIAFKFSDALAIGDPIVMDDGARREYLLGVVAGNYEFRPDLFPDHPHVRRVDWHHRVSRDALSPRSRSKLRSMLTLFEPDESVLVDLKGMNPAQFGANDAPAREPSPRQRSVRGPDNPEKESGATRSNRVFVSYSHADRAWLNRLQVHLKPLERLGTLTLWDDTRIEAGSPWREEIEKELDRAKVAVLLISADFLASDFITTNELPRLLAAAERHGTLILPVILSPCRFEQTPSLSRFQAVNRPSQPLVRMRRAGQDDVFVALSHRIESALQDSQNIRAATGYQSTRSGSAPSPRRGAPRTPRLPDLKDFVERITAANTARVNREVAFEGFVVREMTSGSIEVFKDGGAIIPVKPVLRQLASKIGVSLLNTNGNPRNTRQLGSELIKKLGR